MSDKRIAVIGCHSFSGSAFVSRCLRDGWDVLGAGRSNMPDPVFCRHRLERTPVELTRFRFVPCDLNRDMPTLLDAIRDSGSRIVVNFAAQSMVAESWLYPDDWYQTNVLAMVRLTEGLRKIPALEKYVHISTPEVYGHCEGMVSEDAPFRPSTPYAASRAACELHLQTFVRRYGFPAVATRAANVFGAGQQIYRIVPRALLSLALGKKLPLHGGGHSVRSFIHIDDVVDGTLRAALHGNPGDVFHFSTRSAISIRDLVALICSQAGVEFPDFVEIVDDRPGKDSAYLLDSTRARETLWWEERVSLEQGIAETRDWVEKHLPVLRNQPMEYIHKP
jgi:dTDP-glucose 4,6-dehydratase